MTKEQLAALTVKELKAMAKENGLKGYSKLRKADLIELLAVNVVEAEEVSEVQESKEVQEVQETKTVQILDAFFTSCLKFWQNEKDRGYTDTRSVEALALNDVRAIKNNPFSPNGKALDLTVKENWMEQKEKENNGAPTSALELLKNGKVITWIGTNNSYMPRYYKYSDNTIFYTDEEHGFEWLESSATINDFRYTFDYVSVEVNNPSPV